MTTEEALRKYLTDKGIRPKDDPAEQLYPDTWFSFYVAGRRLKVVKLGSAIQSLALHDLHHLVMGFGTDWVGEAEVLGWELASGGCGRHWVMWIDRVLASPIMLIAPRAAWRAIRAGWKSGSNLYRFRPPQLLDQDFEKTRALVSGTAPA